MKTNSKSHGTAGHSAGIMGPDCCPGPLQGKGPFDVSKRHSQGNITNKQLEEMKGTPRHKPANGRDESEVRVER